MIIYKTTNKINGKIYIGKDSKNRPSYFGSGIKLKRAIKKYGKTNFIKEIIEHCETEEQLNEREIYWIKVFNSTNPKIGYNLTEGGAGGNTWANSDKRGKNIEALRKGAEQYRNSPEGKAVFSKHMKERWKDAKYIDIMRGALVGREISWKHKIQKSIKKHWENRSREVSDVTREKLSKASKGKLLKQVNLEHEPLIITLYNECGPKTLCNKLKEMNINYSPYVIRKFLIQKQIYKKYSKGIGD